MPPPQFARALADDHVPTEGQRPARPARSGEGGQALLTDTVGFIQKLPSRIVAAFRATLEELQAADLLLHVVDITHKNAAQQAQEVVTVLDDLGLADTPILLVLNKLDLVASDEKIGNFCQFGVLKLC